MACEVVYGHWVSDIEFEHCSKTELNKKFCFVDFRYNKINGARLGGKHGILSTLGWEWQPSASPGVDIAILGLTIFHVSLPTGHHLHNIIMQNCHHICHWCDRNILNFEPSWESLLNLCKLSLDTTVYQFAFMKGHGTNICIFIRSAGFISHIIVHM